jgi:hypothetical protein
MAVALNVQAAELVVYTRSPRGFSEGYREFVYYIANPKRKDAISLAREIDPNVTFAYWRRPRPAGRYVAAHWPPGRESARRSFSYGNETAD